MAGLRRDLDGADLQRGRDGEDAGVRDGVPQRRADSEPLRAEGRDALHRPPVYKAFDGAPIKLQSHGDPSKPISFRNIWIREL